MGLRLFTEDTAWDQARRETRFTMSRLAARKDHGALAKPLRALLGKWTTTDQERRDADDAVVDANALVSALDEELDEAVDRLANRLLYEAGGNGADPIFKAYFPEPPSEVIRLGLESEIARTKALAAVAEERKPSKEVKALLKVIADVEKRGEAALRGREAAYGAASKISLRVQAWKEDANAARRSVENQLDAYAIQSRRPRGYADGFFPAPTRARKNGKKQPARETAPA
jgi:hypothetical protein